MSVLKELNLREVQTFLPENLVPKAPQYFVWFTGTLGQAEWLISHSRNLRGRALPLSCPKDPRDKDSLIAWPNLPKKLIPLISLEQPDLIVTDDEGTPLISIEITEQQPIGLNAQQRMGRFWSAVANKIPCAYLLPIEGYQIEKASSGAINAYEETNPLKRRLLLRIAQLPNLSIASVERAGIEEVSELEKAIQADLLELEPQARQELKEYLDKHVSENRDVIHIREVQLDEYIHKVGSGYQKAYIRKAGVPGSMLLSWFETCNNIVPTAAFQIPISYKSLFRSNGRVHTIEDKINPHLSYRNLPPAPGSFPPINRNFDRDEITLFFDLLDSVIEGAPLPDLGRAELTKPNEFYSESDLTNQRIRLDSSKVFDDYKSADYLASSELVQQILKDNGYTLSLNLQNILDTFSEFSVYKIYCAAATRSLGDPYSGALAVRDILFTRNLSNIKESDLFEFQRSAGLVFWTDLVGDAARQHKFISRKVDDIYSKHIDLNDTISTQEKIVEIIRHLRAELVPKDIRAHILFPDLIVIRRVEGTIKRLETYLGLPSLLKLGIIDSKAKFLESLRI